MTDSHAAADPVEGDALDTLLRQVAEGDQAAFEALYRASSPRLFGICLRLLPSRAEAEDVLQEVYASVWSKAAQFDAARARASTWLAAVARNRSIDHLRASPAVRQAPAEIAETLADPGPDPADAAGSARERRRLDDCMQELEARRRDLIRTAFFEGATYEELAARIGSPLGTVKSWIRRGLLQLRACLEQAA
ncbi:MAG: sigma-70 family RNA polymerase sigma factor [Gammaproteobacteria bacterium]